MKPIRRFIQFTGLSMAMAMGAPVIAQTAPVYDVDNLPRDHFSQQDDRSSYSAAMPMQESDSGIVRVQNEAPSSVVSSNVMQRLQRLEEQMRNSPNGEAVARMESLQDQVQSLRGQVEQLTHQLEQLQAQQKNLNSGFDRRLDQNQPATPPAATPETGSSLDNIPVKRVEVTQPVKTATRESTSKPSRQESPTVIQDGTQLLAAGQPNVAEEQQIYQSAYNLIKAKKYNDAVSVLQKMLAKYPSGQFASNAHYWLGELFGLMGKHDQALTEFNVIVKTYPQSPRVSDAQLKVGLILASQSKWSDAKSALKKVVNQYPGTSSSKMATEQLKQIKQAGH